MSHSGFRGVSFDIAPGLFALRQALPDLFCLFAFKQFNDFRTTQASLSLVLTWQRPDVASLPDNDSLRRIITMLHPTSSYIVAGRIPTKLAQSGQSLPSSTTPEGFQRLAMTSKWLSKVQRREISIWTGTFDSGNFSFTTTRATRQSGKFETNCPRS
jgi:hypothetical protein